MARIKANATGMICDIAILGITRRETQQKSYVTAIAAFCMTVV